MSIVSESKIFYKCLSNLDYFMNLLRLCPDQSVTYFGN